MSTKKPHWTEKIVWVYLKPVSHYNIEIKTATKSQDQKKSNWSIYQNINIALSEYWTGIRQLRF